MSKQWADWSNRWDTLSKRERGLLLLTAIVVPIVLIYVLLIESSLVSLNKLPKQIDAIESELSHQKRLLTMLQQQEIKDPDIAARKELKSLRQQLKTENDNVRKAARNLVSPQQMLLLLRSVLENDSGADLHAARSLPVQLIQLGNATDEQGTGSDENANKTGTAVIYQHPFEVELKGNYQGIYRYLQKLEQLEAVFFWDVLEYNVDGHPSATVKIKVHTLSYEAGWLGA
ncbi:MAG: type II secretion system protein GspM [Neptuniibacter sp.]